MFPLIIVAFAGIGVTRLALLALELHESNNPEEATSSGEAVVTKEATIEEMRRLEKPKKLVLKNDCQYVCIWREEDLNQDLPLDQLLRSCSGKGDPTNDFYKAWQDFATFFDQMVGKTPAKDKAEQERAAADNNQPRSQEGPDAANVAQAAESDSPAGEAARDDPTSMESSMATGSETGALSEEEAEAVEALNGTAVETMSMSGGEEMCLVCYDNQQDAVLLTCGHGSICFHCAVDVFRSTRECPLCRSKVDQIVTVGERELLRNGLYAVTVTGPL